MSDSWKNTNSLPCSPWTKWEDEQWPKTAIRTLCKRIQISTVVATALDSDEAPLSIDNTDQEKGPRIVASFDDEEMLAA